MNEAEVVALTAERDRLRDAVVALHSELVLALGPAASSDLVTSIRLLRADRDRMQAVVDAADELLGEDRTSWSPWHAQLADALAALDGNEAIDG